MPTTSPDSIYYADGTTPASIATITAAMANSVQDALDVRGTKSYIWANQAARVAQTLMSTGDTGLQSDTNTTYIYTGSAWKVWAKHPTTYTPTFTNCVMSASTFIYSVSGGRVFVTGKATVTSVSGVLTFSTPTGFDIDTSYFDFTRAAVLGPCGVTDTSSPEYYDCLINVASSSTVTISTKNSASTYVRTHATSSTVPMTWAAGDLIYVNFSYPVATA